MEKTSIKKVLCEKLEYELYSSIEKNKDKNPWKGSPFEGTILLGVMNDTCDAFRGFLNKIQTQNNLNQDDIDDIIRISFTNVSSVIFDNVVAKSEISKDEFNSKLTKNFNEEKFKINSIFYKFCFSEEVAGFFLDKGERGKEVAFEMATTKFEHESMSLRLFRSFLQKYNIIYTNEGRNYQYKSFKFSLSISRLQCEDDDNYFEILSNDIKDVKDQNEIDFAVATDFIVYVENHKPKSLYAIVFDPFLEKFALRAIFENGTSYKMAFIQNNDKQVIAEHILDYE